MSASIRLSIAFALICAAGSAAAASRGTAAAPAAAPVDEAAVAAKESDEALRHSDGVAAIVNDSVISNYDVRQRVALFMATSGVKPTPEAEKKIRAQVLKQLETERLQLLEAEKNKVTVSASDVDKAISDIENDNHMSTEQLGQLLSRAGVRMETLRGQIAAQIAWSKLVQEQLGDRVHVSKLDVDDELQRLKADADKPRYAVAEIFQAVDTPEQDAKIKKDMEDLEVQLHAGAPFSAVARQLSQNPTAAQGGDLGVVQEGQLAPELDKVLKTLRPGQISDPIRSTGGYYILFLRGEQMPANAKLPEQPEQPKLPPGQLPLMRITLPVGPKPPKDLLQRAMEAAGAMRAQIESCSTAKSVADRLHGTMVQNLGLTKLADLSVEMRSAIEHAEPGSATDPFLSPAGIEVIVRCDPKPAPKIENIKIPTVNEVENQLYEQQITTLARQYLRDLKRDADIEDR